MEVGLEILIRAALAVLLAAGAGTAILVGMAVAGEALDIGKIQPGGAAAIAGNA